MTHGDDGKYTGNGGGDSAPDDMVVVTAFSRRRAQALCRPRHGHANPERVKNDFWQLMITHRDRNAWWARKLFDIEIDWAAHGRLSSGSGWRDHPQGPVFCFRRYGRTTTTISPGRTVSIGGEHEDFYDPDFCIYSDVVVEDVGTGDTDIYIYPIDVFPPTDFHSATLVGDRIIIIGGLGYANHRRPSETPVHVLDTETFKIRPIVTGGEEPGWIYRHDAVLDATGRHITVSGGTIYEGDSEGLNVATFVLDLETYLWVRIAAP